LKGEKGDEGKKGDDLKYSNNSSFQLVTLLLWEKLWGRSGIIPGRENGDVIIF